MGALIGAWPRTLDAFQIDEILPHQDHAADRDLKLVATIVSSVRRKLGHEAIETIRGEGYRAGRAFVPYAKVA
jgi:DNA-binding response OmpR family regulator